MDSRIVRFTRGEDRRFATLVAGGAMLAGITAWRFLAGSEADAITLLYALPIALVAVQLGLVPGLTTGALAFALFVLWALLDDVDLGPLAFATRAIAFSMLGGLTGWLAERRDETEARNARWFDMSNDMLAEASLDGYFTRLNATWTRVLGYSTEELTAAPFLDFVHPDDRESTLDAAGELAEGSGHVADFANRYRAKDGSWKWLLWSSRSDGERIYAIAKDITDRKQLEAEREQLLARLDAMARTDELTGLPNRRAFDDELRREIAKAARRGERLTVALVDLDHFKQVNDEHGHATGDELLRDSATAWRLALRVSDFIARFGGDEFGVLLPGCPPDDAGGPLSRLREATPRAQTCSVGTAAWDGEETAESLLARADAALYEAKHAGRDRIATAEA